MLVEEQCLKNIYPRLKGRQGLLRGMELQHGWLMLNVINNDAEEEKWTVIVQGSLHGKHTR